MSFIFKMENNRTRKEPSNIIKIKIKQINKQTKFLKVYKKKVLF